MFDKKQKGGNQPNYSGFCDNELSQCSAVSNDSCTPNKLVGGKKKKFRVLKKSKKLKGGSNFMCGDVKPYTDFCDNHLTQCCSSAPSNCSSDSVKGGKKPKRKLKKLKGGSNFMCGDVKPYTDFCDNHLTQCCSSTPSNCSTNGGKKKNINKGGSYFGAISQLNSSSAYSPSVNEINTYNANISKRLDIPCMQGGGIGPTVQLASSSPTPLKKNGFLDYSYEIMDNLSSKEPPLSWTTNFNNATEASEAIKKNSILYEKNIQTSLQKEF